VNIDIPKLPEINTQAWEDMITFMREDIDSGGMHTMLISKTRELLESQGRDFDAEFINWKKENGKHA
jgi:hypothetical protein